MPSFHWLRNALRAEILNGRIMPGSKLPASREFARQYQLSRGTILAALDELRAEGYVEGRRGSGTYVSQILPEHLLAVAGDCRPGIEWERAGGATSFCLRYAGTALHAAGEAGEQRVPNESSGAGFLSHHVVGAA